MSMMNLNKEIDKEMDQPEEKITIARIISHALDPSLMWPLFVIILMFGTGLERHQQAILLIPVFFFEAIMPVVFLMALRRKGKVSDWEMTDMAERRLIFVLIVLAHAVSLGLLIVWGNDLTWQIRFIAWVIQVLGTALTYVWKISVHMACFTMIAILLLLLFGVQWWPVLLLIPLLAWSRVVRKKHTVTQVVAGTALTALVMLVGLWIFSIDVFLLPLL